ncbi:MAG: 3-oxoacyl-ACP synthase III family protein [Cyanobacteria bacterium SBLK]|nr:3-oxoacyl-ACP synthase III family protein [Cyanobacteria bacterium SBLK]
MPTQKAVGIRSIAVSFPKTIRTNDYWKERYPEMVEQAEQKNFGKLFSVRQSQPTDEYTKAMLPYIQDPFRGGVERRILGPGESSLTLEYQAASDALSAAEMSVEDVDLMLVASLFPEDIAPGNASFLARDLGLRGAAWNIESTCSSALVTLQSAEAMVRSGLYRNVLVVVSTTYSRFADEDDTLSWFFGDGAGAVVISELEQENQGIICSKILHTGETCGAVFNEFLPKGDKTKVCIRIQGSKVIRESAKFIKAGCEGVLKTAGLTLNDVDFFSFNTASAWYVDFCQNLLGIDPEKTLNLHPRYSNIGAVLALANLYHGAQMGKLRENDVALVSTWGASGTAGAMLMRWGKVALGPAPALPLSERKVLAAVG